MSRYLKMPAIAGVALVLSGCPKPPLVDIVVSHPATSGDYGYVENNPIKVGGVASGPRREHDFLDQLAGAHGESLSYSRVGSCCPFATPNGMMGTGLLDRYEITIEGDSTPRILFLNMYDFEEPLIPSGFTARAAR